MLHWDLSRLEPPAFMTAAERSDIYRGVADAICAALKYRLYAALAGGSASTE